MRTSNALGPAMTSPAEPRLKLNLSQVLEAGLADAIRRQEGEAWLKKNRGAFEAYNEHVERHGVFSDGLRSF
jgi:antitoxin CcdA